MLRSRQVVWTALLASAVLALLAGAFLRFEQRELREAQRDVAEMYARVLEDQTSAAVSATGVILDSLSTVLTPEGAASTGPRVNELLASSLRDRPYLRSLSLLDASGRVLASSNPDNVGKTAPETALGADLGAAPGIQLGQVTTGRDLKDLGQVPLAQARVLGLPMVKRLAGGHVGRRVVALINPDYFATQYERILDTAELRALLLGLDGQLIVGTSNVSATPGASMQALPAFTDFLPRLESGSAIGTGSDGAQALSAFRVSRHWPLVVLVEQAHQAWPDGWRSVAEWTLAFLLTGWVLLAGAATLLRRSFLRDELLNRDLLRAHAATRASESRKLAILESSLDAIVTVDAQGRVIEFNAAAERMFGYTSTQAVGRPMHELIVPMQHRAAHQAGMTRYQATGVAHVLNRRIEIEALRADGSVFPTELTIVPVRTADGEIFTATLRDITERRALDQALRDSRRLLEETGRIAGIGGWEVDVASGMMTSTDQACRITEILPGTHGLMEEAFRFYAPEAQPAIRQAVEHCVQTGEGFDLELPFVTARGRRLTVRVVGAAEQVDGRTVRLMGALQDITERVQATRELALARSREVMIGKRIQQSLLVDAPDQRLPSLWLSTLSQASQGIDGDFVQLITLSDRGVDIIVGDVMGKGVAAALMSAATKMQFSRCVAELLSQLRLDDALPSPAEVVAAVHKAMTPNLQVLEAFVTLSYLRLDTRSGTITWVGCGHEEPLLLRADGSLQTMANQHPPLGVLDDSNFEQDTLPFQPGDAVFLCSDGAADAELPDGTRLGRTRVTDLLQALLGQLHTPAAALHALRRELGDMGAALNDDLTLALAMFSGSTSKESRRELAARVEELVHVRELVANRCAAAGLDEVTAGLFVLACVEAFTNVVRHTRGRPDGAPVEVVVRTETDALVVDMVTLGEPFVPARAAPETDFAAFPEGGFGLSIIERAADEVAYLHALGVNTVRLKYHLKQPQNDAPAVTSR